MNTTTNTTGNHEMFTLRDADGNILRNLDSRVLSKSNPYEAATREAINCVTRHGWKEALVFVNDRHHSTVRGSVTVRYEGSLTS